MFRPSGSLAFITAGFPLAFQTQKSSGDAPKRRREFPRQRMLEFPDPPLKRRGCRRIGEAHFQGINRCPRILLRKQRQVAAGDLKLGLVDVAAHSHRTRSPTLEIIPVSGFDGRIRTEFGESYVEG